MSALWIISFLGFCLGLIACCILLFANKTQRHANHFLVISLAGLTLSMLHATLSASGYYLRFPHLFRVFSPFFYMIMPAAYLYLRAILFDETKYRKWDFIHFMPAVLHFFELIPWYAMDSESKRELISKFLNHPDFVIQLKEGLLPAYMHNIIRSVLAIGYLLAMHLLLRRSSTVKEGTFRILHSIAFRWLRTLTYLLTFLAVFFLAVLILPAPIIGRTNMINVIISSIFIVINFFLFSKPQILYGIPHIIPSPVKQSVEATVTNGPTELVPNKKNAQFLQDDSNQTEILHSALDYLLGYQPLVENHLSTSKPFLKQGYSLIQLSEETGIPRHHLSALLNKIYGIRFNDFINRYRVQYITQNMNDPKWPNLTLEGIAREAGFNSRTTFFNAIKKFTGLTPSDFLERARHNQINLFQQGIIL
jgi:AraC-like DNA-binding protein